MARRLKQRANENDPHEDRGFAKPIQEQSKEWTGYGIGEPPPIEQKN
jgi:hypothetical protein